MPARKIWHEIASRSSRTSWKAAERAGRQRKAGEQLKVISSGGCWCGDKAGHDWPGKEDRAPHPKVERRN